MALTLSTKEALGEVGDLLDDADFIEAYCAAAILLGACFAWSPKNSDASSAVAVIRAMDVASDWPFGEGEELATAAQLIVDGIQESDANLAVEYSACLWDLGIWPRRHGVRSIWTTIKYCMAARGSSCAIGCARTALRPNATSAFPKTKLAACLLCLLKWRARKRKRFPSCSALTYCLGLDIISIYSQARHGARRIKGLRSWQRRRSATCKTCWA